MSEFHWRAPIYCFFLMQAFSSDGLTSSSESNGGCIDRCTQFIRGAPWRQGVSEEDECTKDIPQCGALGAEGRLLAS